MPARTIKGMIFTIIVDGKRITVKHISAKGKRCRVTVPDGAIIESGENRSNDANTSRSATSFEENSPLQQE